MRLFLALLLLAGKAWGACASGTLAYLPYQNSLTDTCGGYVFTTNGTLSYDNTNVCPVPGTYMRKGFTGTNRDQAPAGFLTAFSGSSFTVETYLYITATPKFDPIARWDGTGPAAWELSVSTDLVNPFGVQIRRFSGSWSGVATSSVLSVGVCYHIAATNDGTTTKLYVDNSLIGSASIGGNNTSQTLFYIGNDTSSYVRGFLSGFRVSNVVRTSFPTVDPVAGNTIRGMKLRNMMKMYQ